jgi:CRISPR-associated protein Csx10
MAGLDDSDLQLHAAYSSYDYRSGWNAAWGLMKDVELVTNRGAVYLFSTPSLETWKPLLKELEHRGVGERTQEGFGQVQVCSDFHKVFREEAV